MKKLSEIIAYDFGAAIAAGALFIILAALWALPVWLLWNWVGVKILSLPHITLVQAWGILTLSGCLFKSSTASKS